jgi:ABC-type transport system involved in multi-copper enzyme maturation permease subunit
MMVPPFAAGTIAGEKERKTYEMLLASPLRPSAIVFGKLVAALLHVCVFILGSLPIIVLCLPLGGVSVYEVAAAYVSLVASIILFGMVSIACSSYFPRVSYALIVSYLLILPLAMLAVSLWAGLSNYASLRLFVAGVVWPVAALVGTALLFWTTSRRLLHPPDVGSEGKEVVDLEEEAAQAVGLVIQPNQFPDCLFAPPKRTDLLDDGTNPVYDKEIRSEIFSQGTLMLRLVIQISILLALPLMAICLFMKESLTSWYVGYVLIFNMMVGPVFSAGSLTSERERQTLELLLATTLSPWQIVSAKLLAGFRISSVLTSLLLWPLVLAAVLVPTHWTWPNWAVIASYLVVVGVTCITTCLVALCCSALMKKTSHAMILAYAVVLVALCFPAGIVLFVNSFYPDASWRSAVETAAAILSPVWAVIQLPIYQINKESLTDSVISGPQFVHWLRLGLHCVSALLLHVALVAVIILAIRYRWRFE